MTNAEPLFALGIQAVERCEDAYNGTFPAGTVLVAFDDVPPWGVTMMAHRDGRWVRDPVTDTCVACQRHEHRMCEGRVSPDCALGSAGYRQTNACDCWTCEDLAGAMPTHYGAPYPYTGEAWTDNVDDLCPGRGTA